LFTKSESPLWIDVQQSLILWVFILTVHLMASISLLVLTVNFELKLSLLLLVYCSLLFHGYRYQAGYYQFILKYTNEFSWQLVEKDQGVAVQILGSSVINSIFIVLHVQLSGQRRSLLILNDAVSTDNYRQLKVFLKITSGSD